MHPQSWTADRLALVPGQWRERVRGIHAAKLAPLAGAMRGAGQLTAIEQAANGWLLDVTERFKDLRIRVDLSDSELCELARTKAAEAFSLCEYAPGHYLDANQLRARLAAFVAGYGIKPPHADTETGPAIARMVDEFWWRRALRRTQARQLEACAIELGYVSRRAEIYASNATVERREQQRRRNAKALENSAAVNLDTGEVFSLADLAARSVANPRIRHGELMTRISGFEACAKGLGHAGLFLTMTAPSAYHAKKQAGARVIDNPRWNGSTPRQAQQYLTRTWANARAALFRAGVRVYGFRIAEPHHDGTPHWHFLLFVAEGQKGDALRIIAEYARRACPEEMTSKQAKKARFDQVLIDWKKGSAAGYVAKYISKNIDGGMYQVQGDFEGDAEAIAPTNRVEAWASTWGIRQFQQVGGPPVGVWRELRRLPEGGDYSDRLESARAAADCGKNGKDENGTAGNWRRYVELMGGPLVERDALPLRVAYTKPGERYRYATGETVTGELNRFGELAPGAAFGVADLLAGQTWAGVRYSWEIKRGNDGGKVETRGVPNVGRPPAEVSKPGNDAEGAPLLHSASADCVGALVVGPDFSAPWTRVNNCSGPQEVTGSYCRVDFEWMQQKAQELRKIERGSDGIES